MYKSIKELFTPIADFMREKLDIVGKIPTQDMPQRVQDLYFTGLNFGRETGESVGYTRGYSEGEIKGREQGLTEGKEQGKTEAYGEIQDLNAELEQTLYGTNKGESLETNVGQTNADFQAIKNKIVEKGVEVAEETRTAEYASKVDEVYEKGKQSMIDESKIIVKTASGAGTLTIEDVSELPHDIQCQLESLGEIFDINEYTIIGNAIGFDISKLALGEKYIFTSKLPIKWFKISATPMGYNSVANEVGSFTEFEFTMARNANIPESETQYLFLGFSVGNAITDINQLDGYDISIRVVEEDVSGKVVKVNGANYMADENGLVTGIKSVSPVMQFEASAKMVVTYHQSYGVWLKWNVFWDEFQKNGTRHNYQYAFCGDGWNDETFEPKYDMILGVGYTGSFMFRECYVSDMKSQLEQLGVILDTSKGSHFVQAFQLANTKSLPTIDFSSALTTSYCFNQCRVESIDKLIFSESTYIDATMFNGASEITNVIFDGVVCGNLNMQWSTKLTHDSLMSIINALKDYSGTDTWKTITLGADNLAKLTTAELDIMQQKQWNYG